MRTIPARQVSVAAIAAMVALALGGCGLGPRPLSLEEKIWFDIAKGYELARADRYAYRSHYDDPYAYGYRTHRGLEAYASGGERR